MTALMTRPTAPQFHRPNRRRRVALLGALAGILAAAALAFVVYSLTRPAPLQAGPHVPPLQAAQKQCQTGTFAADGSLILEVAADRNDPSAACVLRSLGIPAERYAMVQTALRDAVPDFGNATNTISWGRFYAVISPRPGGAKVQIVPV